MIPDTIFEYTFGTMPKVPKSNVNRTCAHDDCTKRASFGHEKPSSCKKHKSPDMVSFDPRSCRAPGCSKRPNYSLSHDRLATHCHAHKTADMVTRDRRICQNEGCTHRARFALQGNKPKYCLTHMEHNMVNVTRQVCVHPGCNKYPCYGYNDSKKQMTHCVHHHTTGMINVKQKTCTAPMCTAYAHSPRETKGLCLRCFAYMYPDARRSKRMKTRESATYEYLCSRFTQITFLRDQIITGGCSKYRPDILCDMLTHVVIIEIDEHQHEAYDQQCENKRLASLWQDLAHRPIVVLRFNPDAYTTSENTKEPSCFRYNAATGMPYVPAKRQPEWTMRLETLGNRLDYSLKNIPTKSISVEHLYYDGFCA